MKTPIDCMIVAGEVSGDLYGAALMRALDKLSTRPFRFFGIGGDRMLAAGAELRYHTDETGVMGVWEVLPKLRLLKRALDELTAELEQRRPALLLTVDYPGFNLHLAARARARGITTVHYISPKVWAWRRGRVTRIASVFDRLLAIFPFEAECYADTSLPVTFVGHPLVDRAHAVRAEPPSDALWGRGARVALLPGSRSSEIARHLPRMLKAAELISKRAGGATFRIPMPTKARRLQAQTLLDKYREATSLDIALVSVSAFELLRQSRAALIASGTATLEACLMRCPTIVVYRVAWPTYLLGRLLVRGVRHIGLVNIVAGREVCPELLQGRFTAKAAAEHILPLLEEGTQRAAMLDGLDTVNAALGPGKADQAAARAILDTLEQKRHAPPPSPVLETGK